MVSYSVQLKTWHPAWNIFINKKEITNIIFRLHLSKQQQKVFTVLILRQTGLGKQCRPRLQQNFQVSEYLGNLQ